VSRPVVKVHDRARGERDGSVLIEFTLLTPLLVALFLGTWQFGYAYFLYDKAEQAVRAGARYASERTYDSDTSTPSAAFVQGVRNVVLYGDPAGGTTPVVPDLAAANVKVEVSFFANGFVSPPGQNMLASGDTSKPAIRGHFKTGHRKPTQNT
jgi:hypothetical protein